MRDTIGSLPRSLPAALAAVLSVTLGGWGDLLDPLVSVNTHDRITASSYEVPENVKRITGGMVADFECALGNYILAAGIAGDEVFITNSSSPPQRCWTRGNGKRAGWALLRGVWTSCDSYNEATPPIYRPLSTARWQADNLLNLLDGSTDDQVPNRAFYVAKAAAYAGYRPDASPEACARSRWTWGSPGSRLRSSPWPRTDSAPPSRRGVRRGLPRPSS